jgi:imidazolonepropionase-like amidohydrolase
VPVRSQPVGILLGVLTLASCLVAWACQPAEERGLVLVGVTVLDGRTGQPLEGALVVIEGDRIEALGPQSHVTLPKGLRLVPLQGHFVLPALSELTGDAAMAALVARAERGESPEAVLNGVLRSAATNGLLLGPGAAADLLVLNADPRGDLGRLVTPHALIVGGKLTRPLTGSQPPR